MSFDLSIYCKKENLPTCAAWVAEIVKAEFPIELIDDISLVEANGWHPVRYNEFDSGFELSVASVTADERTELKIDPEFDFSVTVRSPHDAAAIAAGVGAAAALASVTGGMLIDADSGDRFPGIEALEWAKQALSQLDEELAEEDGSLSEEARELLADGLNNALNTIADGEEMLPFLLSLDAGEAYSHELDKDTMQEAVEFGRSMVMQFPSTVTVYAIVFDGVLKLEEGECDAVLVEIGERGSEGGLIVGQPYGFVETDRGAQLELFGEPIIVDDVGDLLTTIKH